MIIDAMDLLYSKKFDAFALISSDSDFTKLASRLKESQIYVFGVGEKKTPISFRNACDDFIYTELLNDFEDNILPPTTNAGVESGSGVKTRQQLCGDTRLINLIRTAINEYADDDGWAALGLCGGLMKRQHPDFDSRTYGYPALSQLIEATTLFEMDRRKAIDKKTIHIFIKDQRA